MIRSAARVAPLGELDEYQVAEGHPDVRGWDVVSADGRKVGTVHELIVDESELRTRCVDVTLDRIAVGIDEDRDILLPVGSLRLDGEHEDAQAIRIADIDAEQGARCSSGRGRKRGPALAFRHT